MGRRSSWCVVRYIEWREINGFGDQTSGVELEGVVSIVAADHTHRDGISGRSPLQGILRHTRRYMVVVYIVIDVDRL